MTTVTYYKLVEIQYKSQSAKFKIRAASRSAEIQEAIRARFDIAPEQRFTLVDKRDDADVVVDGTLETGSYTLELIEETKGGCCPPGSLPASAPPADYKVKGKTEKWNGVPVYVSGNKESKSGKAIIIFTDIFGVNGGRHKQIADEWALSGYLSVVPDFFGDDAWNETRDFAHVLEWIKKYPYETAVKPRVEIVLAHLEALGFSKFGSAGFCWGSFGVLKLSATGKFSAGVSFHPSHPRMCASSGIDEAALVDAVVCPQLIFPAGNDGESVKEKGLADQILSKKKFKSVIREFPDVVHGFAVRGDLNDPKVNRDVRISMDLATSFFNKHL